MITDAALGMINNAALLLSLGVLYFLVPLKPAARTLRWKIVLGTIIGVMGIALMVSRWELRPGLYFDTRSILLVVAGLFFGSIPTSIAIVITSVFRIAQGGVGAITGVGVIVSSGGLGLFWRRYMPNRDGWLDLYLVGILVHVVMLGWMLAMPQHIARDALRQIAVPVLLIYPIGTMLLGKLLDLQRHRRSAREEAERNEIRLRRMLENAWGVIHLVDDRGVNSYVSDAVSKVLGYSSAELIGQRFEQIIHPDERGEFLKELRRIRANPGASDSYEIRFQHKDGHWVWVEAVATNLLHDPDVQSIVINTRDMTERRQMQMTFGAVLKSSLEGFFITDERGFLLDVNDTLCRNLGYTIDELVGKRVTDISALDTVEEMEKRIQRMKVTGGARFESRHRRKDGSLMDVEVSVNFLNTGETRLFVFVRDMTERMQAERELIRERERLANIIESTDVSTWEWNVQTDEIVVNERWAEVVGYTLEELQPTTIKTWEQFVHPEDLPEAYRLLDKHFSGELDSYIFEGRLRHKDGHWIWIMDRGKVTKWTEDGKPLRMFGTHTDITDLKTVEANLRESQTQLIQAQKIANGGHYVLDILADRWESSSVLDDIFEIDENFERTAAGWLTLVHPEDRRTMQTYLQDEVIGKRKRFDREYRIVGYRTHQEKWVHGYGEVVTSGGKGSLQLIGIIQDVTDQKMAERELARERILLQQITQNSPIGITVVDRSGVITFANPSAEKTLGLTLDEMTQRTYNSPNWKHTRIDGSPFPDEEQPFIRVMETGEPVFDVRHAIVRPDGNSIVLSVNAAPLKDDHGEVTGMVGMIEDITEEVRAQEQRERAEAELLQAQKMDAIGRLAGGIAHDFNNMLAVIMSTTEMAIPGVEPDSSLYKDLMEIDRAAQRSADLTRQLLTFSRKQIVKPKVINLNEVIANQEGMLRRLIGEDIEIKVHARDDLWAVFIDPSQVDQILANLIVNARDAIGGVGKIAVETDNVFLDEQAPHNKMTVKAGDYVMLSITDNGVGMDDETVERIFEPFFTTKNQGEGTGLGLSTVYGIVEQNHGVIHVYSEPEIGTTFKIYLPRHLGDKPKVKTEAEAKSLAGSETILVVEDEETILKLAKRFLEKSGYKVLTARTPMEAIGVVHEHGGEIDLLLSDVVMPGMNGKQLQERLITLKPSMLTLFMSGYTADVIAQRGLLEEGINFIQKPFTMKTLVGKVREVLDS